MVTLFTYMHICYAQSTIQNCPVQTVDPGWSVQIMDWPRNPGIARCQRRRRSIICTYVSDGYIRMI